MIICTKPHSGYDGDIGGFQEIGGKRGGVFYFMFSSSATLERFKEQPQRYVAADGGKQQK